METPTSPIGSRAAEVRAYLEGNAVAFYRIALSLLRRRDLAEEAVQESIVEALSGVPALGPAADVDLWFRRILGRQAERIRQERRRRDRRMRSLPDESQEPGYLPVHLNGTTAAVAEAVAELSEDYGAVVREYRLEERGAAEAASRLGIPLRTFWRRLKEADRALLARLRKCLPEWQR